MTHRARIADFIHRFPGRDDDEISAALRIKPRQAVNQICRALAEAGEIERRVKANGKLGNFQLTERGSKSPALAANALSSTARDSSRDVTTDWFWEGNVTEAIASELQRQGWVILSQANTRIKERGVDLHLARENREVLIEVKGYPSKAYRDPARAGQQKPTNPTNQAQHWYSHALLKVLRMRSSHPTATAAMAFPDFPRYRALFEETRESLKQLGIGVLFVAESGSIEAIGL